MIIVTIRIFDVPHVPEIDRVEVKSLGQDFWQVAAQYGFKDDPDLPEALTHCAHFGLEFDMMDTSFFLGRETLIARAGSKEMVDWRVLLFATMFRNATSITAFFRIPSNRVVELGSQAVMWRGAFSRTTPPGVSCQPAIQHFRQGVRGNRLGEIVVHAGGQATLAITGNGVGRHGDDRERAPHVRQAAGCVIATGVDFCPADNSTLRPSAVSAAAAEFKSP